MFDYDARFLVFEEADVRKLRDFLTSILPDAKEGR